MTIINKRKFLTVAILALLLCPFGLARAQSLQNITEMKKVDAPTFQRWMREWSNWGRWGKDDQKGAVNLITEQKRIRAAALVKTGEVVSLSHPIDQSVPAEHWGFSLRMVATDIADTVVDRWDFIFHGPLKTHLDALCHDFHNGKIYNGYDQATVTERGCGKNAISQLAEGIFTRGVLIDFTDGTGAEHLKPGAAITAKDLERWVKKRGITIEQGDAVFIRIGRWHPNHERLGQAGLHASAASWFRDNGVAVVGTDNNAEVYLPKHSDQPQSGWNPDSGVVGEPFPFHKLLLVAMGIPLFDNLELEGLRSALKERNRSDFLLTVNPLPVKGGTGSPVNPIAIF